MGLREFNWTSHKFRATHFRNNGLFPIYRVTFSISSKDYALFEDSAGAAYQVRFYIDSDNLCSHIFGKIHSRKGIFMFLGFAFLMAGALLLLSKLDIIRGDFWDYLIPIVLIALGAKMIIERRQHHF